MDAVMTVVLQVLMLALLAGYFLLMGLAAYAVFWVLYHLLHDHWTLARTWLEARARLTGATR